MTELIYKIGDHYTTNYAIALSLRDQTRQPITRIYRPVEIVTDAQKAKFKAHAEKAAEYRKKNS